MRLTTPRRWLQSAGVAVAVGLAAVATFVGYLILTDDDAEDDGPELTPSAELEAGRDSGHKSGV